MKQKNSKKAEVNILFIGVILVALATAGALFYSIMYKPAPSITEYNFDETGFVGEETVLLGDEPELEQPLEIPTITITGMTIGTQQDGQISEQTEFNIGDTITITSEIADFNQPFLSGIKYAYAMEQWISTQDEFGDYIPELTGMTANTSKYVDAPVDFLRLTNELDTSSLSPGTYTIKIFVVDRFTEDIDLIEEEITII
ncbi:MAG: hypothetical protein Q8O89_08500 [Nanoarchaeota archaeon]|nr:hypothetical protein [Nanoarchaeota archaeon]